MPAGPGRVAAGVAHLVDSSLLVRQGDRYRQLDLIRTDALERLRALGEEVNVLERLVDWALSALALGLTQGDEPDLAAAVHAAEALARPELSTLAQGLAEAWEETGHGHWAAAENLYELAARASNDPAPAISGAELAWSRGHGDRAVALFELAVSLASARGDAPSEAHAAAGAAEVMNRYGGTMVEIPPPEATVALVERSESAATKAGDASSLARASVARMWLARRGQDLDAMDEAAGVAVAAAQRGGDPAVLSSALDGQTAAELRHLHAAAAAEIIAERLGLSENFTGQSARLVLERIDALYMACEVSFLMGDFEGTLSRGLELHQLAQPRGIFYGGLTHLAPANFLLGNFNECLEQASGVYWEVTHRRDVGASMLVRAFASAGAVCGYRGDEKSAARWFARAQQVAGDENCSWKCDFTLLMQADVHLHHGRREEAALLLAEPPPLSSAEWRGWHAAIRAEALGGRAIDEAKELLEGGTYSRAVLARARGEIEIAHAIFQESGAVYQAARTALLLRGPIRDQALATYKRLGLSVGALTLKDDAASALSGSAK